MADKISEALWLAFTQKLKLELDDKELRKALAKVDKTDEREPRSRLEAVSDLIKEIPKQVMALTKRKKELGDKPFGLVKDKLYAILEEAEAIQKKTRAAQDAEQAKDDEEDEESKPSALIDPKWLLKQLNTCRKDPERRMKFAFVDAREKQPAMLAMHPRMSARALFGKLQVAAGVKTGAYGSAWVDETTLMLQLDKPLSGLVKKVRSPVKACGFRVTKAVLWNADGSVFEQDEQNEDAVGDLLARVAPEAHAEPMEPTPKAPPQPSVTYEAKLAALLPRVRTLADEGSVDAPKHLKLLEFAAGKAAAKDYLTAVAALGQLERLLNEPSPKAERGVVEAGVAFKARMAEMVPRLKEARSLGLAGALDATAKATEAGMAAAKRDFERAGALLDEAGQLLAAPPAESRGSASEAQEASADAYGAGYAKIDARPIHDTLRKVLEGTPPRMLTLKEWADIGDAPEVARDLVTKWDVKTQVGADTGLFEQAVGEAAAALAPKRMELIASMLKDLDSELTDPQKFALTKLNNYWKDIKDKRKGAAPFPSVPSKVAIGIQEAHKKQINLRTAESRQPYAALLDSSASNSERKEVGELLNEMDSAETAYEKEHEQLTARLAGEAEFIAAEEAFVKRKCAKLLEVEKTLFAWNDRRTRQNLPPSAEAVAMADLVQKVHFDVTKTIIGRGLPLTVSDSAKLSEDEEKNLQATWKELVDGSGQVKVGATPQECGVATQEEADQFRVETLAGFARLLGSEGGRHLLEQLKQRGRSVKLRSGTSPGCKGDISALQPGQLVGDATTEAQLKENKKSGKGGTPSEVHLVMGAKDSDNTAQTVDGVAIFSPAFLIMGHELIHALHNSRGVRRKKIPLDGKDAKWNNMEEYRTIFGGRLSEQTLRSQFGLSAERFGHLTTEPAQKVEEAYKEAIRIATEMARRAPDIETAVKARGFDGTALDDRTKLAIAEALPEVKGPLPAGWNPNHLSVAQMRGIVEHQIPFKLDVLGWSAFELPDAVGEGDSIRSVTTAMRHHPRSAEGRRLDRLARAATRAKTV